MIRTVGVLVALCALSAAAGAAVLDVPGAYPTIQAAIDASAPGDEIVIAAGTYDVPAGNLVPHGGLTFRGDGPVILTGCTDEFFYLTSDSAWDQVTRFEGLRFEANDTAIRSRYAEPPFHPTHMEILDCEFVDHTGYRTIMAGNVGEVLIEGCRFEGGIQAFWCYVTDLEMRDCALLGQTGTAVFLEDGGERLIENCLFAGGRGYAAVLLSWWSDGDHITLRNCTIVDCGVPGGQMFSLGESSDIRLEHCIVADSEAQLFDCDFHCEASLSCCDTWNVAGGNWSDCIVGAAGENGNFSADPLFCDPDGGDYRLDHSSPCTAANSGCGLMGALPVGCGLTGVGLPPTESNHFSRVKSLY